MDPIGSGKITEEKVGFSPPKNLAYPKLTPGPWNEQQVRTWSFGWPIFRAIETAKHSSQQHHRLQEFESSLVIPATTPMGCGDCWFPLSIRFWWDDKTNMTINKHHHNPHLKMYFLLIMGMFHCHVSCWGCNIFFTWGVEGSCLVSSCSHIFHFTNGVMGGWWWLMNGDTYNLLFLMQLLGISL